MNALLQESTTPSKRGEALKRLNSYVEDLAQRKKPMGLLEAFEREVHQLMAEVEQEVVAEGLGQFDIDGPVVEVDGRVYTQVFRGPKRYLRKHRGQVLQCNTGQCECLGRARSYGQVSYDSGRRVPNDSDSNES